MSKEIVSLMETYLATKARAELDLYEIDFRVRAGHESAKIQAQKELPALLQRIRNATIPTRLVGVFADFESPELQAQATKILTENGGVVIDGNELFVAMGNRLQASLGEGRSFEANQQAGLQGFVNVVTNDLNIPKIRLVYEQAIVPTFDDLVNHCRALVLSAGGWNLLPEYVSNQIVQKVTTGLLDQDKIPVLVVNSLDDAGLGHLFSRVSNHSFTGDLISSDELLTVFKNKRDVSATKKSKQDKEQDNE